MDESFVLQAIGRLYLENLRLTALLREVSSKDIEITELRRQLDILQRESLKRTESE